MLRSGLTLILAVLALTLSGSAGAVVTVFQNPSNNPTPAAPVTIVAGGPDVVLNLYFQTGTLNSPGCPGSPPTCKVCDPTNPGPGDEVCGWDIHIGATHPSITLESFTPDNTEPGSDRVWAISGNVLRVNDAKAITGELGVHRIGSLVVSAAPGGSGSVVVTGNLTANHQLGGVVPQTGNFLGTVGVGGPDGDGDGIPDTTDNCPTVNNPGQEDGAGGLELSLTHVYSPDGVGDACDNCLRANNPRVVAGYLTTNPWRTLTGDQIDDDHDGYGNRCDGKFTGTPAQAVGGLDLAQFRASNTEDRRNDTCGTSQHASVRDLRSGRSGGRQCDRWSRLRSVHVPEHQAAGSALRALHGNRIRSAALHGRNRGRLQSVEAGPRPRVALASSELELLNLPLGLRAPSAAR